MLGSILLKYLMKLQICMYLIYFVFFKVLYFLYVHVHCQENEL